MVDASIFSNPVFAPPAVGSHWCSLQWFTMQGKDLQSTELLHNIATKCNIISAHRGIITPSWHKSKEAAENQCRVSSWLLAVWVIESYQIIFENAILILITILNAFFIATADAVSVAWISWPVEMLRAPISFKRKSGFTLGPYIPTYHYNKYNHNQFN